MESEDEKEIRKRLHQALLGVVPAGSSICEQAREHYFTIYKRDPKISIRVSKLLNKLMNRWPLHSGDRGYPVPHDTMWPYDAYLEVPLWEGTYGDSRKQLLSWLIKQTEEPNEGMDNT